MLQAVGKLALQRGEHWFLQDFLSQIQVNILAWGYLTVYPGWKDLDYIPGYNKFYFICGGEGYLKIADQVYDPQPGEWFWMPRGVRQSYASASDNRLTKYWCHFTATIGDIDLAQMLDIPHKVRPAESAVYTGRFASLIQACESRELAAVFRIKSILLGLIADYLELAGIKQLRLPSPATSDKLQQVVRHIEQHLAADMPVEELARITHLHPNYFSRIFRSHLGQSPVQYINRRRIARASQLVLTSDENLAEIARQVGIHDICYFSRLFREQTGYAPSEYRKLNRGQPSLENR
jgi:AraC family transcriptional regulator, arabinose operon regulatory protein